MIGISIAGAVIIVLWFLANATGILQRYKIPTSTNEPTIKPGDHIFTSNLKKPQRFNYIVITSAYEDSVLSSYQPSYKNGTRYLYRLCAIPGDTIMMENAVLFVNNRNADENLNIKNQFKISKEAFNIIEESDMPENTDEFTGFALLEDSAIVTFDNTQIKKYQSKIKFIPLILYDSTSAGGPFKWLDKEIRWTADNFGPLVIPPNHYFVLGDNRHASMDSRFTGFVKKEDIKGVVLNK